MNQVKGDDEDINTKNLKEAFLNIFDPTKKDEDNQEQEFYEKKNSKTGKEIARMENGEDAVQFFAMFGDQTPVKFIYCKKKVHEKSYIFRPYDLHIINMKQVKNLNEYFVITPSGITHVYTPIFGRASDSTGNNNTENSKEDKKENSSSTAKGGKDGVVKKGKSVGEFFTLSDWMYQSTLFNILKRINFFKNYLPFKIFIIWRNYHRLQKVP